MALSNQDPKTDVQPFDEEESTLLLGRIMQDLELPSPSLEQSSQYHSTARVRFLAPRVLAVLAALLAAGLALWCFLRPAAILDVGTETVDGGVMQRVSFRVKGPVVCDISARLDGYLLPVQRDGRLYTVEAARNGRLMLEVETPLGGRVTETLVVNGVDEETPHLISDDTVGEDILIYLTDGNGTGVDWANITAALADGTLYPYTDYDAQAGYVRFRFPAQDLYITVPDRNGNQMHATLALDPAA